MRDIDLVEIAKERLEREGSDLWDPLFIPNSNGLKRIIERELVPTGDMHNWVLPGGVHVHAKRSPVPGRVRFRFEFVGESWRAEMTAVFGRRGGELRLSRKATKLVWVADHGCERRDRGVSARRELHAWLVAALAADDEPA